MNGMRPESVGLSTERLQRLTAAMQGYIDRQQVAGVVTVLARRGEVAHVGVQGWMDLASQKPMQANAIFRLFSMTKPITTLAVLMLMEEGRFQLSHPVAAFIPALQDVKVLTDQMDGSSERVPLARPITIHDLLTHTSGLGYGLDNRLPVDAMYMRERMLRDDEPMSEKILRIANMPLHHQPGVKHTYSMATDVLGYLVELVSGMPLDEFFQRRIFDPLGMADTGFCVPAEKLDRLTTLYTPAQDGHLADVAGLDPAYTPAFLAGAWVDKSFKPAFLCGGGGLVSTAEDYLRFGRMLRNNGALEGTRLVSRKTIELMTAIHLHADRFLIPGFGYGLSVVVMTDPAQAQMPGSVGAFGGAGAANTEFWVDPVEDMIGILMVQIVSYTPPPLGMDFRTLAMQAIAD